MPGVALKLNFRPYIRQYTSSKENLKIQLSPKSLVISKPMGPLLQNKQ